MHKRELIKISGGADRRAIYPAPTFLANSYLAHNNVFNKLKTKTK